MAKKMIFLFVLLFIFSSCFAETGRGIYISNPNSIFQVYVYYPVESTYGELELVVYVFPTKRQVSSITITDKKLNLSSIRVVKNQNKIEPFRIKEMFKNLNNDPGTEKIEIVVTVRDIKQKETFVGPISITILPELIEK